MELELKNDIKELVKIERALQRYGETEALPVKTLLDLNLALEELVTNIISYAYEDDSEHLIRLVLKRTGNLLTVTIIDDGIPFNPLHFPEPSGNNNINALEPGGLGIHLVKKLTDSLDYSRENNCNVITFRKRLAFGQAEGGNKLGNQQL